MCSNIAAGGCGARAGPASGYMKSSLGGEGENKDSIKAPVVDELGCIDGIICFGGILAIERIGVSLAKVIVTKLTQALKTTETKVIIHINANGGTQAADKLFDALPRVGDVVNVETKLGVVRTIKLKGGGSAGMRDFAESHKNGRTIQIDVPGTKTIKVRYEN